MRTRNASRSASASVGYQCSSSLPTCEDGVIAKQEASRIRVRIEVIAQVAGS